MDNRQRITAVVATWWAVAGVTVASLAFPDVNDDARLLVGAASVIGPAAAAGAAWLLLRSTGKVRAAGVLLVLSALLTPTYFAWMLNLPALVAGAVLVLSPASDTDRAVGSRL